jgi:DNA-binding response OmpR family regulator
MRRETKFCSLTTSLTFTISFKATLQNAGFIVHTHQDPIFALSEFKPGHYDLVILDIKMPKMDGFELYEKIKEKDDKVKICFITADQSYDKVREEEERYCKLDAERFLKKPISNVERVKRIENIMMLNNSPKIQNA